MSDINKNKNYNCYDHKFKKNYTLFILNESLQFIEILFD